MAKDAIPYIYADNAATTPLSPLALEAMMPYLTCEFGNPSGIHRVAREAALALSEARRRTAALLGAAHSDEIYFTSGGSESDNWILRGAVQRFKDAHGADAVPRVITSAIEHHAILHCCAALERDGAEITYLPVDDLGRIRAEDLEAALAANEAVSGMNTGATALVSIMLANNEVGTIEPISHLARIALAHGAPFHTDAVQAVGHIPVSVADLDVDALSLSAHKFHGPRGVGVLYLREGFSIPPLIAGGAQERGERAGTENLAGIAGMVAALEQQLALLNNADNNPSQRIASMRDELIAHICTACDGVHPTGDPTRRLPSIASVTCDGVDGELLVVLLDRAGVAAATGSACSTGSTAPSHVLTAMGIDPLRAKGALRLSLADDITREDLDLLKERVPAAIKRARLMSGITDACER